jgi:hypothetical protein
MRDQLKAGAKKRNWTVTEELLWRLRGSFAREDEERRDPVTRAYCYLISQIAGVVCAGVQLPNWHRNPFIFRSFKLGVANFLNVVEPKGEAESPFANLFAPDQPMHRLFAERYKSPEGLADLAAGSVLTGLFYFNPKMLTQELREGIKNTANAAFTDQAHAARMSSEVDESFYSMSRARHDLGIDEPGADGMGRALRVWGIVDKPNGDKS